MSGRPEEDGSGYGAAAYDPQAWQEFTPWRPGDPSTAGEAPAGYGGGADPASGTVRGRRCEAASDPHGSPRQSSGKRAGRWWSEDVAGRIADGDRVRNRGPVGGAVFSHVPDHTRGRVVSTREGLLGDRWATVEFDNGYTEAVKTDRLERRRGWLD